MTGMTERREPVEPVDLEAVAAGIAEPWRPVHVVRVNEAVVRMARLHGEFPWHQHAAEELFLCWSGSFVVEMEGQEAVVLGEGQLVVVPRGVQHRTVAAEPAVALLVERPETRQYGEEPVTPGGG